MNVVYDAGVYRVAAWKEFCEFLTHYVFKGGSCIIISYVESFFYKGLVYDATLNSLTRHF